MTWFSRLLVFLLAALLPLSLGSGAFADDGGNADSSVVYDTAPAESDLGPEQDDVQGAPKVQSGADVTTAKRQVVNCSDNPAERVRFAVGRLLGDHWRGTRDICIPGKNGKPDRWVRGFCIDRGLPEATVVGLFTKKGRLEGFSEDDSRRLFNLANKYSHTKNPTLAMHVHQAMYLVAEPVAAKAQLMGDIAAGRITHADFDAAMKIYRDSELHGPYKVNLQRKAGKKTVVGTVRGFHGDLAPAGGKVVVKVAKGTAKVLSVNGKTGRKGVVRGNGTFSFTFDAKTRATFTASVTYPSSGVVFMNARSSTNSQRILVGTHRETVQASISVDVKVTHSADSSDECSPTCDGSSVNTLNVCRTSPEGSVKYVRQGADGEFYGSVLVLKPGTKCGTVKDVLYDATRTSVYVCKNSGTANTTCKSGWVRVPKSAHEVICPAWPKVELTVGCDCGDAWAYARFFAETKLPDGSPNRRGYEGAVKVTDEGVVIENISDIEITKGSWNVVPITTPVAPGMVLEASFTSFYAEGSDHQILPRTTRVRIMVLSTTIAGKVSYRKTEIVNGRVKSVQDVTKQVDPSQVDARRVGSVK